MVVLLGGMLFSLFDQSHLVVQCIGRRLSLSVLTVCSGIDTVETYDSEYLYKDVQGAQPAGGEVQLKLK